MIALDEYFDSNFANKIARLESYNKHLYRPNTYLHKWWARRCGTTFRLILKQLVQNDSDRDFYKAGGLEGFVILDPMMGGGTIVHEAIRLGANVIGVDVDPIPVLQARASLSGVTARALEEPFQQLCAAINQDLDPYSKVTCPKCELVAPLRYTIYGLQRNCQCGPAVHVDSLLLREERNSNVLRLCPDCHQVHSEELCPDPGTADLLTPIYNKSTRVCPECRGAFLEDLEKPFFSRYSPLVSAGSCAEHGSFFKRVEDYELEQIRRANDCRDDLFVISPLPIAPGPKSNALLRRGITSYKDLFSSRQLVYLHAAIVQLERFDPEIRLPLALLVSTSLEFNSMLCGYKGSDKRRAGAVRHAFAHHAYSFPYTALENNPLFPARVSGTLHKLFFDRVVQAKKWANQPKERNISGSGKKYKIIQNEVDAGVEVKDPSELNRGDHKYYLRQGSSITLDLADNSVDFVVTDPPYYDSVEYGDLSAFFRVWLRQLVGDSVGNGILWDYDVPHFIGDGRLSRRRMTSFEHYQELMSGIFTECRRVLRRDQARLIFTFHHWKADSWGALTIALKRAGFFLTNRYVVHSENPVSVHINNLHALTDDVILVLAPAETGLPRGWPRLEIANYSNSAAFCEDCGSMVGWMLESELTETEIRSQWQEILNHK